MAEYDPSRDEGYWWLFILLLVGVALLVGGPIVTWMTWQQLQVARSSSTWPQTEMTVTQGSVERKSGRRGRVSYRAEIVYRFTVNDAAYTGTRIWFQYGGTSDPADAEAVLQQYAVGSKHQGYYKPDDPSVCVLNNEVGLLSYLAPLLGVGMFIAGIPLFRDNFQHISDKRGRASQRRSGNRRRRSRAPTDAPPRRPTRSTGKRRPGRDQKGRLRRRKFDE